MQARHLLFLFLSFILTQVKGQQALTLSPVDLLTDSSFVADAVDILPKGTLVDVQSRSQMLHEDATQTQQFYWYRVKTSSGQIGWIMGNELALLSLNPTRFIGIDQLTGTSYSLSKGFDQSVFYWGETVGKDDLSSHFTRDNEYHENYLVFINKDDDIRILPVGTQSERGNNTCIGIYFADITHDGYQEIILFRSLSGKEMEEEVRKLEIYQLVDNRFSLIFEQRLNVDFEPSIPSPARFKFVDISPDGIRMEYPQYETCGASHFGASIKKQPVAYQKCMSWRSESYTWDNVNNQFHHFYQPSSLPLRGHIKHESTHLREGPTIRSTPVKLLTQRDRLKILAHLETISMVKGKKTSKVYFLIKTTDGMIGYLPSDQVTFTQTAHAAILNQFYANPMLIKRNWDAETIFIRLRDFQKESHWEVTGNFSVE